MLDIVTEYARKWRFELNPKKSEVIVFGSRWPPRDLKMKLGQHTLKQVKQYKYLGIELTRTLKWNVYAKRILQKARRNLTHVWAMGIRGGFASVKTAEMLWKALVRSVLEYGCEIWGEGAFYDFEKIQIEMGRRILRCKSTLTNEVVLGDLGWETMKARRDEMRLRYWAKLIRMQEHRIPKILYRQSEIRLDLEDPTPTWCRYTKDLLYQVGLGRFWETEDLPAEEEWARLIREQIHAREEQEWIQEMKDHAKLRTYITLKRKLEREKYLEIRDRYGAPELTKIRGGSNRLRIETGRWTQIPKEERFCEICLNGEVEDETHFMLFCPVYQDLRDNLWREFETKFGIRKDAMTTQQQLNTLIGDEFVEHPYYADMLKKVMNYIERAMKYRKMRQGVKSE